MRFFVFFCLAYAAITNCVAASNPQVYMDIAVRESVWGRVVFELYEDIVPKTVNNFVQLCQRPKGQGYKGTSIYRVLRDQLLQGGDIINNDGTGSTSVYGGQVFDDENFEVSHLLSPFTLTMANRGPDTNGSQFIITLSRQSTFDRKHVAFGKVISGEVLLKEIGRFATAENGRPYASVTIRDCGVL